MAKKLSFGPDFFFSSKIWLRHSLDYSQLSSCTISKDTNCPILRKVSDRRTDAVD